MSPSHQLPATFDVPIRRGRGLETGRRLAAATTQVRRWRQQHPGQPRNACTHNHAESGCRETQLAAMSSAMTSSLMSKFA